MLEEIRKELYQGMKNIKPLFLTALFIVVSSISWGQTSPELRLNYNGFEKRNKVEIFPNPTVDFLNVVIENSDLREPKIEVFNIIGNMVNVQVQKSDDNKYIIDVKGLSSGYYLVTIKDINGTPIKDMFKFLKR